MALTAATEPKEGTSTRAAIVDAAARHFADQGFAGASMRDIAAEVGLKNQASLYHYFTSKERLYDAAIAGAVRDLLPLFAVDGAGLSLAQNLDGLIGYLAAHRHVARLIERAGLEDDRRVRGIVERRLRPLFEAGVRSLEGGAGGWQRAELPHLAAGLYHLIFGYFASASLLQAVMREDPYSKAMLTRQRDFIIAAAERLLAPRAEGPSPRRKP